MESEDIEAELSQFDGTDNTDVFASMNRSGHVNNSSPPPPPPAIQQAIPPIPQVNSLGTTPHMSSSAVSLASDNQLMSNYISSPNPDLPNQYNIIIAGDDDDISSSLSSSSPSAHQVDINQALGASPYRSYTVQFKLNALDWYYKNGENKNLTAKMFSVDRKRIRDWLQDESNLRSDPTPERTKRKRTNCLPQYKDIEEALYQFYIEQREKGCRPKNAELRAKSLEYAMELGYRDSFKASVHWLCNWKRRNKISYVTMEHHHEEEEDNMAGSPNMEERLKFERLSQTYKGVGGVGSGGACIGGGMAGGMPMNTGVARGAGGGSAGGGGHVMDGMGSRGRREVHMPEHTHMQEHMEEENMGGVSQPAFKDHEASEHWMEMLEQSVLALESDVARKFSQIKLLLHQFKKSRQPYHNSMAAHSQNSVPRGANTSAPPNSMSRGGHASLSQNSMSRAPQNSMSRGPHSSLPQNSMSRGPGAHSSLGPQNSMSRGSHPLPTNSMSRGPSQQLSRTRPNN